MDKENRTEKRRLKLVEKYDNDDYTRYAGPDYNDRPFEIGEEEMNEIPHSDKQNTKLRPQGNWHHPGVSGKTQDEGTWINKKEFKKQTDFVGYGPKNYKRSDNRIYEEVCETLMKNKEVDATNIGVKVSEGIVYLSGKVESRKMKKVSEDIVDVLPGVRDVRNELSIVRKENDFSGPDAATKKDLGI